MSKSHYAMYVEEIEIGSFVEEYEWGFFKYQVATDNLYIADLYVIPERRRSGLAVDVANYLQDKARELGLKYITTTVATSTTTVTPNLRKYINYGFKVFKSDERFVYMVKEVADANE